MKYEKPYIDEEIINIEDIMIKSIEDETEDGTVESIDAFFD